MNKTEKHRILLDEEKCIGCGLCVSDCVANKIELADEKAHLQDRKCILCGHCEAICPVHAIELCGYHDEVEDYAEQTRLDPDALLMAIKSRRSVRQFKKEQIPEDVLAKIIEAGRVSPTGSNAQMNRYLVIQNDIADCEKIAVDTFRKAHGDTRTIRDDFFFFGAPMAIVILGRDSVSATIAAQDMTFMAEALGLGVLYSGYFTGCYNTYAEIREFLGMEEDPKAMTTIVLGYPDVKYQRTVHREDAVVIRK